MSELFLKIYLPIFIGMLLRKLKLRLDGFLKIIADVFVFLFFPVLIFTLFWRGFNLNAIVYILSAYIFVFLVGTTGVVVYSIFKKKDFRDYFLPVVFMNSFFLGAPITLFLFGKEGIVYCFVYSLIVTIFQHTVGFFTFIKRKNFYKPFLPIGLFFCAISCGLCLNQLGIQMPDVVELIEKILTKTVCYSMLLFIGYRLEFKMVYLFDACIVCFMRMGMGFLISFLYCLVFGLKDVLKGVIILISSMPPAIRSYILSEYFDRKTEVTSNAIFLGNLVIFIFLALRELTFP